MILGTGVQFFFWGVPPEGGGGGGVMKKNSREKFSGPQNLKFSLSLPHVFGFGRCKEGIFQGNHGYFSRYGWYLCLRAQRPPVCSGCSAAPHPGLLSARKGPQIRQYTLSGAENRTSSIEGQGRMMSILAVLQVAQAHGTPQCHVPIAFSHAG